MTNSPSGRPAQHRFYKEKCEKGVDKRPGAWYNIYTKSKGETKMFEYMSVEEIVVTMTEEEWFDLMTECFIDEIAEEEI